MRVWLYARLSNDDDREMNSLLNQREICQAFAEQHGYTSVGQSYDDNASGMNFNRRGLDKLTAAVDADMIDAVIVKDLSRLGRHKTQTALFIDYLRERQVRVISATEGVDTFRDEDDLIIGVRGLMNDYYAKDIGKKIRAGYRQKQKDGIVITPPFGYWKDKNTGQIKVDTEAAVTVQLIYSLYLQGCGQKEISRRLNVMERKTPAQLRAERCGREVRQTHKTRDGQFLWTYASVKNILVEEAYTGVLNNHRREYNNGKAKHIDKTDWYRHEDFFPVIIGKQEWVQVQALLKRQARPANGNQAKHRYAGLLTCWECGNTFIPMIRCWNGKSRVEYVCRGYHRNGKSYCSSHRIHEETLDEQVWALVSAMHDSRAEELKKLAQMQKMWALRKPILDAHILSLQEKVLELEQEIDEIVIERIMDHRAVLVAVAQDYADSIGYSGSFAYCFGRVLSYAPTGDDGIFPHEMVRDYFEHTHCEKLIEGFIAGKQSQRGVHTVTGGMEEKEISIKYREDASKLHISYPHTAAILEKLAECYWQESLYEQKRELLDFRG